ncbi:methyltransferase domain-containing protein [Salinispira pacifica]|uniref:Arsenite methyltransferase n=1 Tax=Salinispira pacifica TaxID=1307761 RepID=V5WJJ1_9SPIO|nr:methyltransferase domain-containing protein [Salinispira pacifica]AHC15805.1 SAM-dependent methyltransferase [Salinispira pacifica]
MSEENVLSAIDLRYSDLAETSCCLSCGGAIDKSQPRPGEVCVDLGSGRGNDLVTLAEAVGPEGRVHGVDISRGMLAKARKTITKLNLEEQVELHQSNLEYIPLKCNSVDLLISNCTINHAADKGMVWKEIHRILKPGGRFVVSDIYSLQPVPHEYAEDPQAVAECWAGSVTREEYITQLSDAGFKDVQILEESTPYDKGKVEVCSWTILGYKTGGSSCCSK